MSTNPHASAYLNSQNGWIVSFDNIADVIAALHGGKPQPPKTPQQLAARRAWQREAAMSPAEFKAAFEARLNEARHAI